MSGRYNDSFPAGNPPDNSHCDRCTVDNWENCLDSPEMADYHYCHCFGNLVAAQPVKTHYSFFLATFKIAFQW
jgi:hypothetical protein